MWGRREGGVDPLRCGTCTVVRGAVCVHQYIPNWWGRGIRGSPLTSTRLKSNVRAYTAGALCGLIKEPKPAREFHHSHVFLAAGPQATSPEPADIMLAPPRDG